MVVEYLAMINDDSGARISVSPQEGEKIRQEKRKKYLAKNTVPIVETNDENLQGLSVLFEQVKEQPQIEIKPFNLAIVLDYKNQDNQTVLAEINKSDFNLHSIPIEILPELVECFGEGILLNVASWITSYESVYDSLESIFNHLFENQKPESKQQLVFLLATIIKLIENLTSLLILEGKLPPKHKLAHPVNLDLLILQHYDELLDCKNPQIEDDEFPSLENLFAQ
jgi:hypothetical protein